MEHVLQAVSRETRRRLLLQRARLWILLHPRAADRIRKERAWIFGASAGRSYCDNSAALHRYVRNTRPDITAYWTIDRDSRDVEAARAHGPVLFRDSIEAQVRALLAAVHVVSHGVHDVPALTSRHCRAFRVRLGHGITATRVRRAHALSAVERANQLFDLVPVSSDFEKENKSTWGIAAHKIEVTGVPRFDTLLAKQRQVKADSRRILYMPTWRDGTVRDMKTFKASEYARGIRRFLELGALHDSLVRNDAYLHVFFHPIARPFAIRLFENIACARIIIESASDPQVLFTRVGALVTDYSSVVWDFLYLDKPVIFYQFDKASFEQERGSHLGGGFGWPGPVVVAVDELADLIDQYLIAGRLDDEASANVKFWTDLVFAYRDDQNCARAMQEIEKRMK